MPTVDQLIDFTGRVIDAPDIDAGCRTKITVKVDGDVDRRAQLRYGLHRVTCYGNLAKDLTRFCRLAKITLVNEDVGSSF